MSERRYFQVEQVSGNVVYGALADCLAEQLQAIGLDYDFDDVREFFEDCVHQPYWDVVVGPLIDDLEDDFLEWVAER